MKNKSKLKGGLDSLFTPQTDTATAEPLQEGPAQLTKDLLQEARGMFKSGRPKQKQNIGRPAAERGCKTGEGRVTFVMNKEQAEALKDVAYWQRIAVKDALQEAVAAFLADYERKHGPLKSRKK